MSIPQSRSTDELEALALPEIEQPFVGQWKQLISTTNWEKGRIVFEWREALVTAGAGTAEYADEAWSRRVGGVSSQHVGRLRRVYQRFGGSFASYRGLYWSHFQAAVDWDDAELWLEGAVQNAWPVAEMRNTRATTLGEIASGPVTGVELHGVEMDEDFDASLRTTSAGGSHSEPSLNGPAGDENENWAEAIGDDSSDDVERARTTTSSGSEENDRDAPEPARPFEHLGELPLDVADALDAFKLAILRHKADGWRQIDCPGILGILEALRELALAPASGAEPF